MLFQKTVVKKKKMAANCIYFKNFFFINNANESLWILV